ncbi:MAG: hypothetical protein Kow00127_04440 [Bacteroidales bacterium]
MSQAEVIIVTGESGSGKTGFVSQMVTILREAKVMVSGILAHGFWDGDTRERFEIEDLQTGKRIEYCSRRAVEGWDKIRKFYINPESVEFGNRALSYRFSEKKQVIIIDEIGPFELAGKGWAPLIHRLVLEGKAPMVWVVRPELISEVCNKWGVLPVSITDPLTGDPGEQVRIINRLLNFNLSSE